MTMTVGGASAPPTVVNEISNYSLSHFRNSE
jgi:hypothetical protein